jgi:hypothetical protein
MIRRLFFLAALMISGTAQAEWHEATSNNFVVYSEGTAQDAQDFAAKLERFHFVLRTLLHVTSAHSPVKLRVFLLADQNAVMRSAGGASVAGYYNPGARGLMLVGTRSHLPPGNRASRVAAAAVNDIDPESVLLHEYTHHFTFEYFPATYPVWYSEGFAEFWGATKLLPNDVVEIGAPAEHRFSTFQALGWLSLDRLLRAHSYAEVGGQDIFLLYAEGWLLMRYVFEHPDRQRQLQQYLSLVNAGTDYAEAARQAFPDLDRFNSELFDYASAGRFNVVRLPFRAIDVGPITVRTLRPAEQAMILDEIHVSNGYEQREASEFAQQVQSDAAPYPDDPFAVRLVMETQHLAGNETAALAAANRLLALDAHDARALMVKGQIQLAALETAHSTDRAAWTAARQPILEATRAAPADPVVQQAYYESFPPQGILPPDDAQNALYTAMELAPSDGEIRYELALDYEHRHMIPEAIAVIRPEAYSSAHRGNESESERRRREERLQRERPAGRQIHETALELLTRLQGELAPADRQRQAEAGH